MPALLQADTPGLATTRLVEYLQALGLPVGTQGSTRRQASLGPDRRSGSASRAQVQGDVGGEGLWTAEIEVSEQAEEERSG